MPNDATAPIGLGFPFDPIENSWTLLFPESTTNRCVPSGAKATPCGNLNWAAIVGPVAVPCFPQWAISDIAVSPSNTRI